MDSGNAVTRVRNIIDLYIGDQRRVEWNATKGCGETLGMGNFSALIEATQVDSGVGERFSLQNLEGNISR